MPKVMKRPKTLRLPARTIAIIERLSAEEGIPQQAVVSKSVWYYDTLEDRLAEAIDAKVLPEIMARLQEQTKELISGLIEAQNRILEKLSK